MKRFLSLVVTAAFLSIAAGVVTAQGAYRPDDRATHGPGAVGLQGSNDIVRPDDRATHGQGAVNLLSTNNSIRPDDRATHGPGAFGGSSDPVRPDDRAWRGVGPEPTIVPVETQAVRGDGFDWVDAGIGALAAFGFGLILVGASVLVARRQRMAFP